MCQQKRLLFKACSPFLRCGGNQRPPRSDSLKRHGRLLYSLTILNCTNVELSHSTNSVVFAHIFLFITHLVLSCVERKARQAASSAISDHRDTVTLESDIESPDRPLAARDRDSNTRCIYFNTACYHRVRVLGELALKEKKTATQTQI